jgi:hypothetical protein
MSYQLDASIIRVEAEALWGEKWYRYRKERPLVPIYKTRLCHTPEDHTLECVNIFIDLVLFLGHFDFCIKAINRIIIWPF